MSFSSQVKNEISKIPLSDNCCILCEISAVLRMGGHFHKQDNGYIASSISTENASFARRMITHMVHNFTLHPSLLVNKSKKLKGHTLYSLDIKGAHATEVALGDTGLLQLTKENKAIFLPPEELMGKECCLKSYIRGAFLASGSINHPEKSYHLEITSNHEREINALCKILQELDIKAKVIERKTNYICYVKEAESIADFLNIIGAHRALMEFENIRIVKGIRNNVNRIINFESANLDKTVNAASRQVVSIKYIINNFGLEVMEKHLQDMAVLRLENPHLSFTELGQMLTPSLGKSGVNHRLKKIEQLAEQLREYHG